MVLSAAETFARLLSRQEMRGYTDDVTRVHPLVWPHTDLGPSYYFRYDGRVLVDDPTLDRSLGEATPHEAITALILGSRNLGAPELLELLPSRPANASDCSRCSGSGWWTLLDIHQKPFEIVCPDCHGLGWREPEAA
jgi:hypothetical protein